MYETFDSAFRRDGGSSPDTASNHLSAGQFEPHLLELFSKYGGASFNGSLYRGMNESDAVNWSGVACSTFPACDDTTVCFAYDWLGRIFAVNSRREIDGHAGVLMLEPGTGQILDLPCNVVSFHESELVYFGEAAVASHFFAEWLSAGGAAPQSSECVGYKRPLFLAGQDTVDNLELVDMEVYWEFSKQLIDRTRAFAPDTRIRGIRIK